MNEMRSNAISCAAILACAVLGQAIVTAAFADTVVVSADRMIDVLTGRVMSRPQITITDGRIAAVGVQGASVPDGARRVDLPGMTLLPGLIDMHTWGMTPMQAIQAATANAAEALGRPGDVGAIAVGRYGDLIGVAGDPLEDVARLQSVAFVMKGGEVMKGGDIGKMPGR
jgi:imidazolonepropionase-like amidohydrolase